MKNVIYCLLLAMVFTACKKNELGGKSTIRGKIAHHSKAIANATVYIKFGTQDSPGTDVSKYDAKVTADISGNYEFPGVYKGEYYLYAVGEDFAVPPPYQVVGGIPTRVRYNETVVLDIPVTEGD
ncbi:MAG: hypothetical protein Q8M29_14045 [Bacteroidota bacterium]|nr:hypothetical protein [Bacteroidota bacterium]